MQQRLKLHYDKNPSHKEFMQVKTDNGICDYISSNSSSIYTIYTSLEIEFREEARIQTEGR